MQIPGILSFSTVSSLYLYLVTSVFHDTSSLRIDNSANKAPMTEKGNINALNKVL